MSENTTTPNGDSKDLYNSNPDVGKFTVGFMALEEKDRGEQGNDDNNPGSNTVVAPTDIGEINSGDIKTVGYVGIQVNELTPKIKEALKARAEKSKQQHDQQKEDKGREE